jgi:predicted amidophosphoribosyltransferase
MLTCPSCAHELPEVADDAEVCPRCGFPCLQDGKDEDDIPVLQPITVRPVELNAQLWSEWKRLAEKLP